MPDDLLEAFRDFTKCSEAVEQQALERLTTNNSAKPARLDIEFALVLVNQVNQLFSKKSADIRREFEHKKVRTDVICIERMVRVTLAAFQYLREHRSQAGFSALALEKTLSNFITACTNAHLGTRIWDGLMLLRGFLLEYANTHVVASSSGSCKGSTTTRTKATAGRSVRRPAPRLKKGEGKRTTATKQKGRANTSTEHIAKDMHRLSISGDANGMQDVAQIHFPIHYCQSDLTFNILVTTLLCNILRVLAQNLLSEQTQSALKNLEIRSNSALEWCLRTRELDQESIEPFLGVCFRAYYTLGGVGDKPLLGIRLLAITAYSKTKSCVLRELLKYACRAAVRAESTHIADGNQTVIYGMVDRYYTRILELVHAQVESAIASPELVEFIHHMARMRRCAGNISESLIACKLVNNQTVGKTISGALIADCLICYSLDNHQPHPEMETVCGNLDILANAILTGDARYTLTEWNALILCADIIRKTAKNAQLELRQNKVGSTCIGIYEALVGTLDFASRIYDAYISRGAAAKAESAGGTSIDVLLNHSAEVSLVLIQLVLHHQDSSAWMHGNATSHSSRLMSKCVDKKCSADYLRNHSVLYYNYGANLYQLKIYTQAANAIELSIDSLSSWIAMAKCKNTPLGNSTEQLCKRFEVAALAYQSGGSYAQASRVYGLAVFWILEQNMEMVKNLSYTGSNQTPLPPSSSTWSTSPLIVHLMQLVDRYVRMCAGRLLKDSQEKQAFKSLQEHMDAQPGDLSVRGWLYEAEAFFWRPYISSSSGFAFSGQKTRLSEALKSYKDALPLGNARCLVELAKIARDMGEMDVFQDNIDAAMELAKEMVDKSIYTLGIIAECFAWQAVARIEHDGHADNEIATCCRLWTLLYKQISDLESDSSQKIDSGFLRDVVDLIQQVAELLLSRRFYSSGGDLILVAFQLSSACDREDRSWAPVVMECLVGLGTTSLLCGNPDTAARYFCEAATRYESGVLPSHVEISSKIAYASFQLACGDSAGGAKTMYQASKLAQNSLDVLSGTGMRRGTTKPETLVLLSKTAHAYSVLALKQGALADSVDLGVHSYRVLASLLRSLTLAHKRTIQEQNCSHEQVEDDPFSDVKPATSADEVVDAADDSRKDAEFIAFGSNWELQRLLIDVLVHLVDVYSIRGSTKEAEYFLKKALDLSGQLRAPHQENYLRLREADIFSRKSLWDECAVALQELRDKAKSSAHLTAGRGTVDAIGALLIEGDAWRRCGNYREAQAVYTQAMAVVEQVDSVESVMELCTTSCNPDWGCPQLQRILDCITPIKPLQRDAGDSTNNTIVSGLALPVAVMREDITVRQQLLTVLEELMDDTQMELGSVPTEKSDSLVGRSVDQQPNHLLLQAKLAFFELQRMLTIDESWGLVLKSALLLPALQLPRIQKPRKGTTRAQIKTGLADLEVLLLKAVATAITVGSAHSVHEASHLLALVKTMRATFGLVSAASDVESAGGIVSRVVDDCRNITVMREIIDAMRRRGERIPPKLTVWPGNLVGHGKDDPDDMRRLSPMLIHKSPSASPLLKANNSNRKLSGSSQVPEYSLGEMSLGSGALEDDVREANARSESGTRLRDVVDGAQVIAGWETSVKCGEHALNTILPSNWVVCGLSIDYARNVLFVTRYHADQDPLVLCLPMRSVNVIADNSVGPVPETDTSENKSMFDSAHQMLRAIIADSDKTMKTGSSCTTDAEKRAWWEQRTLLDHQLGKLLTSIEDEWLGGFRYVLEPQNILSAGIDRDMLRKSIEKSVVSSLPKSYATKAKAIQLTTDLCMVVLHVARRTKYCPYKRSEDDSVDNDWLDICSLLWDIYFYQGAAPPSDEEILNAFADCLGSAVQEFAENDSIAGADSKSGRPHLILVLDKHAQQIPWECMPCIRDYPVSRVPSISFLQERILAMKTAPMRDTSGSSSSGELGISLPTLDHPLSSCASRYKSGRQSPDAFIPGPSLLSSLTFDNAVLGGCSGDDNVPGVHVSGKQAFFVLNPEGDLHRTQANFEAYLRSAATWNGVVGRRPMNNECEHGLASSDIFLYFGHGGAESYISRSQIRALDRCAVALLLGCSSGQLKLAGEYDALGTATDYLVGGCPALVGNLWDVGDKDIDRFAASMLHAWGLNRYSTESIALKLDCERNPSAPEQPVSLAEAVCLARKACRMSYLTGAAPVVYGIPAYLT